jgi:hypothetical protein
MTMPNFHAPSRREILLASGTLFAWAHLPRLAHAEGRDPRFLTVIFAARSTDWRPWRRSAIRNGSRCAATPP